MSRPAPTMDGGCGRRWCFVRGALPASVLVLGLAGCGSTGTAIDPVNAGYTVRQKPAVLLDPLTGEAPRAPAVRYAMRTVSLPLAVRLDAAWVHVDETALPPLSRAVWNTNGLRVGVISAENAEAFGQSLLGVVSASDGQFSNGEYLEPLRESPPIASTFFADLSMPPGPTRIETMDQGRLRLLMTSRPLGNGDTRLELIPQNFIPRATLKPRSPFEEILDGRVFDELGISLQLAPDQALVLGYLPPPDPTPPPEVPEAPEAPEAPEPSKSSEAPEVVTPPATPDAGNSPNSPPPPPPEGETPPPPPGPTIRPDEVFDQAENAHLPLTLGRGLFTLGRATDDLQLLILLRPVPRS